MFNQCTYCNSLHKAIDGQNFCSNKGDKMNEVSTNAYYFKSNNLSSGAHVSRLSIRTLSDGFQKHVLDNKEYILDKSRYLIINEGEEFASNLQSNKPIEGLLIAFNRGDYNSFVKNFHQSSINLLDDPFDVVSSEISFQVQDFEMNMRMQTYFQSLKEEILYKDKQTLYCEELFNKILIEIYLQQNVLKKEILELEAEKVSTKKEIFRRIELCRNFIDNHISENISLKELSLISTMSPFHLQRCFSAFYKKSPHQYLVQRRLEKAKFMLKDTRKTVREIAKEIGLNNQSSFGRLFKKKFNFTPIAYRKEINY